MSASGPLTDAEVLARYRDQAWRLQNLYWIITKGDDDEDAVVQFRPNLAQRRLLRQLHNRNVVPKARQLGITTLVAILWLDTALFADAPLRCGIVAHDKESAEIIFRDKIGFAYDRLPDVLKAMFPVAARNRSEIVFAHNRASVRVATSVRGGTLHRLHVSELGKISAKYPAKAREVITGSIPAVPKSGVLVIESTAEGAEGPFHDITMSALALQQSNRALTPLDYRLHFFAWWEAPEYTLPANSVVLDDGDLKYFRDLEVLHNITISDEQKAWYAATLRSLFQSDRALMWQEYPSYVEECFKVSAEGCYYTQQLADARKQGRIAQTLPLEVGVPVNSFWDIGLNDNMAIWLHQRVGLQNRFIRFYKNSGETLAHYAQWLLGQGVVFGTHYLPHDAAYKRPGTNPDTNESIEDMLRTLMPGHRFEIVPRVTSVLAGIQATRQAFASCWIDESACSEGLADLGKYRKQWDDRRGTWKDQPFHGPESDSADAFRQFGQVAQAGGIFATAVAKAGPGKTGFVRRRGSAMAV